MQTIKLEIEDNKLDSVISKYEVIDNEKGMKEFSQLSTTSFETIWDNSEDSEYDKFL